LAQAKYLLSRVSQFEQLISNKFNCKPSVIIAGDFNSTPCDKVCLAFISLLFEADSLKRASYYAFAVLVI
jgi:CCR4-NOT transcription complex subunit 6